MRTINIRLAVPNNVTDDQVMEGLNRHDIGADIRGGLVLQPTAFGVMLPNPASIIIHPEADFNEEHRIRKELMGL